MRDITGLRKLIALLSLCLLFGLGLHAQTGKIDSLKLKLNQETNDSAKVVLLNELAWLFKSRNLNEAENYCLQSIELAGNIMQIKLRSSAYNTLGLVKQEQNKFEEALNYLNLSVKDKEKVGDRKGLATVKNNIGVVYKNTGQVDLALQLYKEALDEHLSLGNIRGQAETISNIGVIYRSKGDLTSSTEYFLKALELRQKLNDKNGIALIYNNLSANASDQNKYKESVAFLYKSAQLFEETENKVALVAIYGNIAQMNYDLKNQQLALRYCKKALELAEVLGGSQNLAHVYATLGDVYYQKKEFSAARKTYTKGLKLSKGGANNSYESHFHLGIGAAWLEQKNFEKALPEISNAVRIARNYDQSKALARSLQKLAKYYVEKGETETAKKPLNEAIRISKQNQYKDILALSYNTFANLHDAGDNKTESLEYLKQAKKLNDSIFTKDLAAQFAEMQTKYETSKKEAQIRILKQQEEINALKIKEQQSSLFRQRLWIFAMLAGLLIVLVLTYFIVNNQRLKTKLEKEAIKKTTEEEERLRISKDIHDELGSQLSKIMFLTEVAITTGKDEKQLQSTLVSISETARSLIENMRDLIWAMNPDNTTLENLVARIREYSYDYLEEFPIELQGSFPDNVPTLKLENTVSRNIYMIVKETFQNIVKHAHAQHVTMRIEVSDRLLIEITDDGKGFDPETVNSGNGLHNLRKRSELLGANLSIETSPGKGTKLHFSTKLNFGKE